MSDHILHTTALWKMGHQRFSCRVAMIGRNVARIEEIPVEVPEYTDGVLARIQLAHGEMIPVTDKYDALVTAWAATLDSL